MTKVKYSFAQWCRDNGHEDWLGLWDYELNDVGPEEVSYGSNKKFWFKCLNENHPDYLISINHFIKGNRCPVCVNRKIIKGINDIATTHPQFVKYFKDQEDATKYSIHSGKYAWFKCPDCGKEKYTDVCTAFQYGYYTCSSCGDGVSYANKFVYCLLKQLQIKNKFMMRAEETFEWSKNISTDKSRRTYDFYINNGEDIIIEVHGSQHYEQHGFEYRGGRTLDEEQKNDLFKYNLAINNGIKIKNYIVLDCRKSDLCFIKKSIMDSSMPVQLNFHEDDIDWNQCGQFALSNLIIKTCELWKSGIKDLKTLSDEVGIAQCTVSLYLRKGDELGLIIYESKANKPIICTDNNYIFSCSSVCSNLSKELFGVFISSKNIRANANNEIKSTHGIHFKYITREQFRKIKIESPWCIYE